MRIQWGYSGDTVGYSEEEEGGGGREGREEEGIA